MTREHPELAGKRLDFLVSESSLSKFACAVIVTDHSNVNYRELISVLPLVIDTRNATAQIPAGNVVKA